MKKIISAMIVTMLLAIPAVALSKKEKTSKGDLPLRAARLYEFT